MRCHRGAAETSALASSGQMARLWRADLAQIRAVRKVGRSYDRRRTGSVGRAAAERLISGTAISIMVHERMNEADNLEARARSVADRSPATISVPAKGLAGEAQAAHSVRARGKLHATRWHVKDVGSTRRIEHVRPLQETRKRLAIPAVADEAEARIRRNFTRDASHMAAPAAKREILGAVHHKAQLVDPTRGFDSEGLGALPSMTSVIYEVCAPVKRGGAETGVSRMSLKGHERPCR
jgi:hypothetical protein